MVDKYGGKGLAAAFYAIPFVLLLCGCLNFLVLTARAVPAAAFFPFLVFHIMFLLALSAVFGNVMIELFLCAFEDRKNSALESLLYDGRGFFPVKPAVFVAVFVAGYAAMTVFLPFIGDIRLLIYAVPAVAVFINAPHFLSGRVRYVSGAYLFFERGFKAVLSYRTDDDGRLVFITEDGGVKSTYVFKDSGGFKALEEEFKKNGLQCAEADALHLHRR